MDFYLTPEQILREIGAKYPFVYNELPDKVDFKEVKKRPWKDETYHEDDTNEVLNDIFLQMKCKVKGQSGRSFFVSINLFSFEIRVRYFRSIIDGIPSAPYASYEEDEISRFEAMIGLVDDEDYSLKLQHRFDALQEEVKLKVISAHEGCVDSMLELSSIYETGKGLECDYQEAYRWALKGALQGNPAAQYRVAELTLDGIGIEKDSFRARQWFELAAKKGYRDAEKRSKDDSGSCFITTATCGSLGKPDDCYELKSFRSFRDNWLKFQPDGVELISEYYRIAPKIVERINKQESCLSLYKEIWNNYLEPCLKYIEKNELLKCKMLYIKMVEELKGKYF